MRKTTMLLCALAAGCGVPADPTDPGDDAAALPPRELRISLPGDAAGDGAVRAGAVGARGAALLGQRADGYVLTRTTSEQLNALLASVLTPIWELAATPPTRVGPSLAVRGPFTAALSPITVRLITQALPGGAWAFDLQARPRASTDDSAFRSVAGGRSDAAPAGRRAGVVQLDLSLLHALDPVGHPVTGALGARYDLGPAAAHIRLHLQEVGEPGAPPTTATDLYDRLGDAGSFAFSIRGDLTGGPARLEDGLVLSRWDSGGAGRTDLHLRGGDSGAGLDATECWDRAFARVFFQGQPIGGPLSREGDPATCAYDQPLSPVP